MTLRTLPDEITTVQAEPTVADQLAWISERYDNIASGRFGPGAIQQKWSVGAAEPQICRYCYKGTPDVSFDESAHALPGLIGNQWLFDPQECDQCNSLFGRTIDRDFGLWSAAWRALERTPNRYGASPKFIAHDGTVHIESDDSNQRTIVQGMSDVGRYTLDREAGIVDFELMRKGFAPSGVFKCLVKMAISVAPQEVSESLKHLKAWIRGEPECSEAFANVLLVLFIQMRPTVYAPGRFDFHLLRRKPEALTDSPYMFFRLRFGGRAYQIALPLLTEDSCQPKDKIPKLPMLPADVEEILDPFQPSEPIRLEDMSSSEIQGREVISLRYGIGTLEELDPSQFELIASRSGAGNKPKPA